MTSAEIRQKFLDFFTAPERGEHKIRPSSSLIPDDPSVLLTSAGMQQFKPYFLGEPSPWGPNVVSVQKCFRTSDIDDVGDERHLTFFEMLGNFSFGGYGKKEAIEYAYEFITKELGLTIDYVTVFEGEGAVPMDEESVKIWRQIDPNLEIKKFGRADNFWGPTGTEGPCGPTTEIYVNGIEIWNLVFNQYYQKADGSLEPLKLFGIDTGMGLERLAMVVQGKQNVFETELFTSIINSISVETVPVGGQNLLQSMDQERGKRIIADHIRAAIFLAADGVIPTKEGSGYILRRLIRRASTFSYFMFGIQSLSKSKVFFSTIENYKLIRGYEKLAEDENNIRRIIWDEEHAFRKTIFRGIKEFEKVSVKISVPTLTLDNEKNKELTATGQYYMDGVTAFNLIQTEGFPVELIRELLKINGRILDEEGLAKEVKRHQEISRAGAEKKFAGGLADHQPATIKLHTAHHLLLATLQRVLGPSVKQRGSNITQERLRLDFSWGEKLTDEQKKEVERIVNEKIKADLPVVRTEMTKEEAEKLGAEHEFGQKYAERVSVYFIGDPSTSSGRAFSTEFCGGPHVASTGELGHSTSLGQGPFKIIKEEAVAQGIRRIRAVLV